MHSVIQNIYILNIKYPGKIIIGGKNQDTIKNLKNNIEKELGDIYKGYSKIDKKRKKKINKSYLEEIFNGIESSNRNIYTSMNEECTTVVDDKSFLSSKIRKKISKELIYRYLQRVEDRKNNFYKKEIKKNIPNIYPILDEHNCFNLRKYTWEILKKENKIKNKSNISINNVNKGKEFEEFFKKLCEKRKFEYYRGKKALKRFFPEKIKKVNGLNGIPDFFIKRNKQKKFVEEWNPNKDCFVEIKRGNSKLKVNQKETIARLKSLNFSVYVLRGSPERYSFEKR